MQAQNFAYHILTSVFCSVVSRWLGELAIVGLKMSKRSEKLPERHCPACDGRGVPAVKQPAIPGRKLFPAPCKKCGGKGRVAVTAD
jgi:hypothetical protein